MMWRFACSARNVVHRPGMARRQRRAHGGGGAGALVLFFPAMLLPILEIEKLGHHTRSSILMGTLELLLARQLVRGPGGAGVLDRLSAGEAGAAGGAELAGLACTGGTRPITYRLMEHVGKWSMMDVLLLAFLVMLVKLGDLVTFHFGPAVVAFTLCVAMSMIASLVVRPPFDLGA